MAFADNLRRLRVERFLSQRELARCGDIRQQHRSTLRQQTRLNAASQLCGRCPRGHDHQTIACVERRPFARERDDCVTKRLNRGNADETSESGGRQCSMPKAQCSTGLNIALRAFCIRRAEGARKIQPNRYGRSLAI